MDLRTLFLAQTCALIATAVMLWVARSGDDGRNGLRTWTLAVTSQGLAYLLLANAGRLPVLATAVLANAAGALSVALFFVAIRQFLGLRFDARWLAAMVLLVTAVATLAGADYAGATIFNGFIYGLLQVLNGLALWRRPAADTATTAASLWQMHRVQRALALLYLLMGLVLPLRAAALLLKGTGLAYLDGPLAWQEPIYVFGLLFVIATNLGFVQLCKMRAEAEVRLQAMSDELTGLANRRALDEAMARALAGAMRTQQPFAVLMVDVDHFKAINDRFGHHTGDLTLIAFAHALRAGLRAQDLCFRYGGEEFCVLLPDTAADAALLLAERLRQQVALPASESADASIPAVSASFGIAIWQSLDTADAMFGRADRALYRAKKMGRNRVEIDP